jgi:hypothetical protein
VPVQHTWLFEPGIWTASGTFWERGEIAREGRGTSIVRHMRDVWVIQGTMEILGEPPVRFRNDYRIDIPAPGASVVRWRSENPVVGTLDGVFVVADDAIMASFRSADGAAVGSEHLTYLAPDRYQARGLFLASGDVLSAWSMALVRQAQTGARTEPDEDPA